MRVCRILYGPANDRVAGVNILLNRSKIKPVKKGMLDYYFLDDKVAKEIAQKLTKACKDEGIKYYVLLTNVDGIDRLPKDRIIRTKEEFVQKIQGFYAKTMQELEK